MKEKSIKKELQKFYNAVEQTADSVFITDKAGVIEYVNPAFEKMTGFKAKEALGKTPRIIKSGLQDNKQYKKLWSTILSGKNFRVAVVNRRKDGKLFYADHTITPIKDTKGNVTHFVGIWKDITKEIQLDQRKEEFMAIASHELKTPLTVLKGYTQFLEDKLTKSKDNKNKYFASQINTQTDKITNLISSFFDASKIHAGKLILHKLQFDLDAVVEKTIEGFKYSIRGHQIIKQGRINKSTIGDPDSIGRVLINLLMNAVKNSPEGSKIFINIKTGGKYAVVSVQDFGIGIPKSEQKKIFERFYQSKEGKKEGFGLGLYITAEIIKQHGGKIWVESKEGEGSTFYFTLPQGN